MKENKQGIFSPGGHFMFCLLGCEAIQSASIKERERERARERGRDGVVLRNGGIIFKVT
jgi:hypothetical protein